MTSEINRGQIEKISIPDDAMMGWMETMKDSGLSQDELDSFFTQLNATYAKEKGIIDVEAELKKIESYILKEHGRQLTKEEREYMRAGILSRYGLEEQGS